MIMWICVLALAAVQVEFDVRPLTGPTVKGRLIRLDDKSLAIQGDQGEKVFSLRELSRLTRPDAPLRNVEEPAPIEIEFVDGSRWRLGAVRLAEGRLEANEVAGGVVSPRLRAVRAIRLRAPESIVEQSWRQFVAAKKETDVLVVRRTIQKKSDDGETILSTEISLDEIEGKLTGIEDANVKFEVEGEVVDIPRARVEGLVLAAPVLSEEPEAIAVAVDRAGSRWNLRSAKLSGEMLVVSAVCGMEAKIPLSELVLLDFSASNTRYLSDLEAAATQTRTYLDDSFTGKKLSKLLAPQRDRGFFGVPLAGGDSPFGDAKGLSLVAYSRVEYRTPKGFERFSAMAAIDPRVKKQGSVMLRIIADDQELYSGQIKGTDAPVAIELQLPAQTRMLTIEADFGPQKELGASLQLRGARFTK